MASLSQYYGSAATVMADNSLLYRPPSLMTPDFTALAQRSWRPRDGSRADYRVSEVERRSRTPPVIILERTSRMTSEVLGTARPAKHTPPCSSSRPSQLVDSRRRSHISFFERSLPPIDFAIGYAVMEPRHSRSEGPRRSLVEMANRIECPIATLRPITHNIFATEREGTESHCNTVTPRHANHFASRARRAQRFDDARSACRRSRIIPARQKMPREKRRYANSIPAIHHFTPTDDQDVPRVSVYS
jgi:hypothetical protein